MGYGCVMVSQHVAYSRVRRVDGESEGGLAEELHSVGRVWEQTCEVLCLRPVSVDNRNKHNVDMTMRWKY